MEWLSPEVLQVGAGGLVTLVVLLVLTGRLVPKSQARALIEQANKNAELWQRAAEADAARADLATAQSTQMLAGMATIEALIRSIVPPSKGQ